MSLPTGGGGRIESLVAADGDVSSGSTAEKAFDDPELGVGTDIWTKFAKKWSFGL